MRLAFKAVEGVVFVLFLPFLIAWSLFEVVTDGKGKLQDWRWKRYTARLWKRVEESNREIAAFQRRRDAFKQGRTVQ